MRAASEPVAQLLHALGVSATENAVVECLEGDALTGQLPLQVLVAVKTQLGVERKVGAELDEEWTKIFIHEVVVVDVRRGRHQPRIGAVRVRLRRRPVRTTCAFSWATPTNSTPPGQTSGADSPAHGRLCVPPAGTGSGRSLAS